MKKRNQKGFTLIELVIVVIIIGILAVVSVPLYQKYTLGAIASEGKALVGAVISAERLYYNEHSVYHTPIGATPNDPLLAVNSTANKYFVNYTVLGAAAGPITIATAGVAPGDASGITVTGTLAVGAAPTIIATKGALTL